MHDFSVLLTNVRGKYNALFQDSESSYLLSRNSQHIPFLYYDCLSFIVVIETKQVKASQYFLIHILP